MADVVSLAQAREEREPHLSGPMYCVGCHHEWVAVTPVGVLTADCPKCGLPKGHWKFAFGGGTGDLVYSCLHCGSEAMTIFKRRGETRIMCMGCGCDHMEALFS